MNKIPTAEEFLVDFENKKPRLKCEVSTPEDRFTFYSSAQGAMVTLDLMREFAKLHVKAALEAAAENGEVEYFEEYSPYGDGNYTCVHSVNKQSILTAYPETNIV